MIGKSCAMSYAPRFGRPSRIILDSPGLAEVVSSPHTCSQLRALRDMVPFAWVRLEEGLGTITWPNGADLDQDVIYAALDRGPRKARFRIIASGDLA
jgi:hypothetical protein